MTPYEEFEAIVKERLEEEHKTRLKYGEKLNIENIDIVRVFIFDKNDYPVSGDYPIVDKGCILIETEYYINGKGNYRCFAIEQETGKFLDIDSNILPIIVKTNKWISRLEQKIKELDFKKADDKNVVHKRIEIEHEGGITTISEKNVDKII